MRTLSTYSPLYRNSNTSINSASRPAPSRYGGVSYLYTRRRRRVWRVIVMRGKPNTRRQCYYSGEIWTRISWNKKAKNTPNAMNIWLNAPSVPDSTTGANYFISRGMIELYSPTHIPCTTRQRNSTLMFGYRITMFTMRASALTQRTQFRLENLPNSQ